MPKKKLTKKRGRKKGENLILCSMTLIEYKKNECIKISCLEEPKYDTFVSKIWWEANKNKPENKRWIFNENTI